MFADCAFSSVVSTVLAATFTLVAPTVLLVVITGRAAHRAVVFTVFAIPELSSSVTIVFGLNDANTVSFDEASVTRALSS